jgi:hypothetical protein
LRALLKCHEQQNGPGHDRKSGKPARDARAPEAAGQGNGADQTRDEDQLE